MKDAFVDRPDVGDVVVRRNTELVANWASAAWAGRCNACNVMSDRVLVVGLRSMEFRLCPGCKDQLQGLLTAL